MIPEYFFITGAISADFVGMARQNDTEVLGKVLVGQEGLIRIEMSWGLAKKLNIFWFALCHADLSESWLHVGNWAIRCDLRRFRRFRGGDRRSMIRHADCVIQVVVAEKLFFHSWADNLPEALEITWNRLYSHPSPWAGWVVKGSEKSSRVDRLVKLESRRKERVKHYGKRSYS